MSFKHLLLTITLIGPFSQASEIASGGFTPSQVPTMAANGIYRFYDPSTLLPEYEYINGVKVVDPDDMNVHFNRDEHVAVKFLPNGQVRIDLLLSEEEKGTTPESIVISGEAFDKSGLRFVESGDANKLDENYSAYERTDHANLVGGWARGRFHLRDSKSGARKYQGCVAYVCSQIGGCSGSTGSGKGMTNDLRKKGWHSLSSCSNPPVGSVASWTGGGGSGHTARWNGSGWCYDKGCGNPGANYRFKDCVAPPR